MGFKRKHWAISLPGFPGKDPRKMSLQASPGDTCDILGLANRPKLWKVHRNLCYSCAELKPGHCPWFGAGSALADLVEGFTGCRGVLWTWMEHSMPQRTTCRAKQQKWLQSSGARAELHKSPFPSASRACCNVQSFPNISYVLIYGDNPHYEILHLVQSPAGTTYWAWKI